MILIRTGFVYCMCCEFPLDGGFEDGAGNFSARLFLFSVSRIVAGERIEDQ